MTLQSVPHLGAPAIGDCWPMGDCPPGDCPPVRCPPCECGKCGSCVERSVGTSAGRKNTLHSIGVSQLQNTSGDRSGGTLAVLERGNNQTGSNGLCRLRSRSCPRRWGRPRSLPAWAHAAFCHQWGPSACPLEWGRHIRATRRCRGRTCASAGRVACCSWAGCLLLRQWTSIGVRPCLCPTRLRRTSPGAIRARCRHGAHERPLLDMGHGARRRLLRLQRSAVVGPAPDVWASAETRRLWQNTRGSQRGGWPARACLSAARRSQAKAQALSSRLFVV